MTTVKSCHAPTIWKKLSWKSPCLLILKSIMEFIKNFKSLYDSWGRCLTIRDICMDFEPSFKVHNVVSVDPKSIILGQMTNLNMIFHVVVSFYRFVKTWNSPQFPVFRNGQLGYELEILITWELSRAQPESAITHRIRERIIQLF